MVSLRSFFAIWPEWHGRGVHVRLRVDAGVELTLTVQAVLDPVSALRPTGGAVRFSVVDEK